MAQTRKQLPKQDRASERAPEGASATAQTRGPQGAQATQGNAFVQEQMAAAGPAEESRESDGPTEVEQEAANAQVQDKVESSAASGTSEHEEDVEIVQSPAPVVEEGADPESGAEEEATEAKTDTELKEETAPELGGSDDGGAEPPPAEPAPPPAPPAEAAPPAEPAAAASPAPADGGGGAPGDGASRADVAAAVSGLGAAASAAGALSSGSVQFRPVAAESSQDPAALEMAQGRRAQAEGVATGFIQHNAGVVEDLIATAQAMPDRIMATTEQAVASIDSAIASGRAQVDSAIAAARSAADSDAAAAHAHIDTEYAAAVGAVESTTTGALASVQTAHVEAEARLAAAATAQTARIESTYGNWDRRFWAIGPSIGDEATAIGARKAAEWRGQKNGESSFWSGPVHDNRMEARADAAENVAGEYSKSLMGSGNEQAQTMQSGKPRDLEGIHTMSTQCSTVLAQQRDGALQGLERSGSAACGQARQAQAQLHQAVDQKHQATLADLDRQEMARHGQLDGYGGQQRDAVLASGAEAAATVAQSAGEAGAAMTGALEEVSGALTASQAPDPMALHDVLGEAQGQFDSIAADAGAQLEQASATSEEGIVASQGQIDGAIGQLGSESATGIDAGAQAMTQSLSELQGSSSDAFHQLVDAHRQGVDQSVGASSDGFQEVGTGIEGSFDQMNQGLDQNFQEGALGLEGGLRGSLKDEERDINKHAAEAAAKVKPRWKKVLKVLLIVAVIVVVCVLAGPLAGFLAGWGITGLAGMVVAGAALGAAAGATIQMGSNLLDGRDLWEGVGSAALMGAIGGAFGGLGAGLASGLSSTVGRLGLEFGIDMIGGVLGELAVGNSPTLGGVLLGAGIGAGVGIGMKGFSAVKLRIKPDVAVNPKVDVGSAAPRVDAGAPKVEAGAPKAPVEAPAAKAPSEAPAAKAPSEAPAAKPPSEAPAAKAPSEAPAAKAPAEAPAAKAPSEAPAAKAPAEAPAPKKKLSKADPESRARADAESRGRIESKYGEDGAKAFDTLVKKTGNARQAEKTLNLAEDLNMRDDVVKMIESGKLDPDSVQGLHKKLKKSMDEVRESVGTSKFKGKDEAIDQIGRTRNEIKEAAERTGKGHEVSIGGLSKEAAERAGKPAGKADIVDYNSKEAVQMKTANGKDADAVVEHLSNANAQLGGETPKLDMKNAEVPPEGFRRVADVRVGPGNKLHGMSRAEVLDALQGRVRNLDNLDSVLSKHGQTTKPTKSGMMRVDTGHPDGAFEFSASELRGRGLGEAMGPGAIKQSVPEMADDIVPAGKTSTQSKFDSPGGETPGQQALKPGTEVPVPPRSFLERVGLRKPRGRVVKVDGDQVHVEVNGKVETHSRPEMLKRLKVDSQQTTKQPDFDEKYASDQTNYKEFDGPAFKHDAPSPRAVEQGQLGDCWLMAAMGATARQKPGAIRRLIQNNGNGTYDVTLHLRDKTGQLVPSTKTVDMRLPSSDGTSPLYAGTGDQDEFWGALLEKRLAMEAGSFEGIRGSKVNQHLQDFRGGLEMLTGVRAKQVFTGSMPDDQMAQTLRTAMDDGRPVVAGAHKESKVDLAFNDEARKAGVVLNHAYSVKDVDVQSGKLTLDNPWGPGEKDLVIDINDFQRFFQNAQVGGK